MDLISQSAQLKPLSPALQSLRLRGSEFVRSRGLPTRKDENWKYTSVKALTESQFLSSLRAEVRPSHDTLKAISSQLCPGFYHVVFVNGFLDRTLSNFEEAPGVLSWSIDADQLVGVGEVTEKSSDLFADAFEAMNAAYLGQGISLKLEKGASLDKPLQIHFHTSLEGGEALMVHPRLRLEMGERSHATFFESYSGEASASYFVNARTDLLVGHSAKLLWVRLQEESHQATQIARTSIHPSKDSDVTYLTLSLGALLCRQNLTVTLNETAATLKAFGITAVGGHQHADHSTLIDHVSGGCTTTQIYKSLLDGESRVVFDGKINIRPNAQKAFSEQLNNNLLLSSKAEADSKPQLMIEADDVKAAHGSTVGQLNKEELFYLMSRGLSRQLAVPLLSYGFLAGVLDQIEHEALRNWLDAILRRNFARFQPGVD
jgi:Fe-S cluster assembly protein SufD